MTNLNTVREILSNLNEDQRNQLLESYVVTEFKKKEMEVNKNYKDENKRNFALGNIQNEFTGRLMKKLVSIQVQEQVNDNQDHVESDGQDEVKATVSVKKGKARKDVIQENELIEA